VQIPCKNLKYPSIGFAKIEDGNSTHDFFVVPGLFITDIGMNNASDETTELKAQRLSWCIEHIEYMRSQPDRIARTIHADEKWFYSLSGRKKRKVMPLQPGETMDDLAHYAYRTETSRRHSSKVKISSVTQLILCVYPT